MANITFSNPDYKLKTVYATAGSHTETILKIAKENKIPIDFSCEDGECGTCVVQVKRLSDKGPMGGPLTKKEETVLVELGKLTQEEVDKMAVDDIATPWRLACQMIVRDEDILVEY
ncbi:MAG: 2Fe-2S iron-sulfur cluster-binding protein [Gammaproteobacteria bacterium]|nr:2Fe-2S iron-sulfur cluster-binding protein [Gammaproteobacteria bacterium]